MDASGINVEDDEVSQAGRYVSLWSLHQQRAIKTCRTHQTVRVGADQWTADKNSRFSTLDLDVSHVAALVADQDVEGSQRHRHLQVDDLAVCR